MRLLVAEHGQMDELDGRAGQESGVLGEIILLSEVTAKGGVRTLAAEGGGIGRTEWCGA
jgi:hypothetical protein